MSFNEGELHIPSGVELFYRAKESDDSMERLAYIKLCGETLASRGLVIEDVGIKLSDVLGVVNSAYDGPANRAKAIHSITLGILNSFPYRENPRRDKR